jgi:cell division protein FtsZ
MALMGVGEFEGENAAYEAIKSAIESPLLDNMSIDGAMGVLVHFKINPNFPILSINDAMDVVFDTAHDDADIIFGTTTDESLPENYVKITIVATGFESDQKTANRDDFEGDSELEQKPTVKLRPTLTRVVNGDISYEDDLDAPAYLRRQQD